MTSEAIILSVWTGVVSVLSYIIGYRRGIAVVGRKGGR